jgi:hypothetical protein
MPVFPSTSSTYLPRRTDSLNAVQQKSASHAMFGVVEEELHDAQRVEKHGQEDDLRYALGMVIRRVGQSLPVSFDSCLVFLHKIFIALRYIYSTFLH